MILSSSFLIVHHNFGRAVRNSIKKIYNLLEALQVGVGEGGVKVGTTTYTHE